jgi:hypothetical protein
MQGRIARGFLFEKLSALSYQPDRALRLADDASDAWQLFLHTLSEE